MPRKTRGEKRQRNDEEDEVEEPVPPRMSREERRAMESARAKAFMDAKKRDAKRRKVESPPKKKRATVEPAAKRSAKKKTSPEPVVSPPKKRATRTAKPPAEVVVAPKRSPKKKTMMNVPPVQVAAAVSVPEDRRKTPRRSPDKPPFQSPVPAARRSAGRRRKSQSPPIVQVDPEPESEEEEESDESVETTSDLEEEEVIEDVIVPAVNNVSKTSWLPTSIGIILVAVIAFVISQAYPEGITVPSISTAVASPPLCYVDTYLPEEGEDVETPERCVGVTRVPCPNHAICKDGVVSHCQGRYHELVGDGCVLSAQSNTTIDGMVSLLQKWSSSHYCGYKSDLDVVEHADSGRPLFHYSRVTGELEEGYDWKLVMMANEGETPIFYTDRRGDVDLYIGLHETVPFKQPPSCVLWKMGSFTFSMTYFFAFSFVKRVTGVLLDSFYVDPYGTLMLTLGSIIIVWFVKKKRNGILDARYCQEQISIIRQATFKHLARSPNENLIADTVFADLSWDLYPSDSNVRTRMKDEFWPQVCQDVDNDYRVAVSTVKNGRKVSRAWKWTGGPVTPH